MKKIFTNRNFSLIFFGNLVSSIGSILYAFAIGWYILEVTGSALQAGIYMMIGSAIAVILTPIAGVIADRFNKVKLIVWTDILRGIVVLFAAFVISGGLSVENQMTTLFICAALLGIGSSLFGPAVSSLQTEVVPQKELQSANATLSLINSIQGIVGIALGGFLYALLGVKWVFIINGLSFIFSGISEMFIKHPFEPREARMTVKNVGSDFAEGFKYLKSIKGLFALLLGSLLLNFAFVPILGNGLPYLFNQIIKTSPVYFSFVEISVSIGTLIGGILVGNLSRNLPVRKTAVSGLILMAVFISIVTGITVMIINGQIQFSIFYIIFLITMFAFGFTNLLVNIPLNTAIIKAINPAYRGRAFGALRTLSMGLTPLAMLIGGIAIDYGSIIILFISCLALIIFVIIYLVVNPKVQIFYKVMEDVNKNENEGLATAS